MENCSLKLFFSLYSVVVLRDPPSKKRKMENCLHNQKLSSKTTESLCTQPTPKPDTQDLETSEIKLVTSFEDSCSSNARKQTLTAPSRHPQKLLLPKPKAALVKLPVMQLSSMPVFVPTADSSAPPVVFGVDHQGSTPWAVHLLPLSVGTLILGLDSEACSLKETLPLSIIVSPVAVEPISTDIQVNLGKVCLILYKNLGTHVKRAAFLQSTCRPICLMPHHTLYLLHHGIARIPLYHLVLKLI